MPLPLGLLPPPLLLPLPEEAPEPWPLPAEGPELCAWEAEDPELCPLPAVEPVPCPCDAELFPVPEPLFPVCAEPGAFPWPCCLLLFADWLFPGLFPFFP